MSTMIQMIQPLSVGNSLRVYLSPPAGSVEWRVLRKTSDTFTDQNDPNAFLVYEGSENTVVDYQNLSNDTTYYYRAFYFNGTVWTASATATGVPATTYSDISIDALSIVRDRIDYGLQAEVAKGTIVPPKYGAIEVLTAPPIFEDTRWPVVTVHLQNEGPQVRAIGEMIESDLFDAIAGNWTEHEGWLASVQIAVVAYSLNPDERIELRKALRRIVVANLPVFDSAGMVQIEFSQQDTEDFQAYNAPVYFSMGTLTCLAPVRVTDQVAPITDVSLTVIT